MRYLFLCVNVLFSLQLLGQSDTTQTKGEIITGEIVIEKDKKIVLPQADKIYIRSSVKPLSTGPLNQTFAVKEPLMEWPKYKSDVPFQQVEKTLSKPEFQNYVRLGLGNYQSWLLESGLYKTFGKLNTATKLYFENFGRGPINEEASGNSNGGVDISATYNFNDFTLIPRLSYKNKQYNFYGNTDRINTGYPNQNPNDASLNEFVIGSDFIWNKSEFQLKLSPSLSSANQKISPNEGENAETSFDIGGELRYSLSENTSTGLDLAFASAKYDGGIGYNRSLINVNPWVKHSIDNLTINVGFLLSSNTFEGSAKTGIYPKARVDLGLTDNWTVYGLIEGGQQWNGLSDLLVLNEFLDDSLTILNTETKFLFGGGLKGSLMKNVTVDLSLTHANLKNLPFFTPSLTDSSRFMLSYDLDNIGLTRLVTDISFMPTTSSKYGATIELNGYSVESLSKAWHRPAFLISAYTSHNFNEKFILSAYLTSMGGIRAPADIDTGFTNLKAFLDLGLGAKYLVTKRASAFIDINNLLNGEYERYLGYPTRGLAFKIGAQYRF